MALLVELSSIHFQSRSTILIFAPVNRLSLTSTPLFWVSWLTFWVATARPLIDDRVRNYKLLSEPSSLLLEIQNSPQGFVIRSGDRFRFLQIKILNKNMTKNTDKTSYEWYPIESSNSIMSATSNELPSKPWSATPVTAHNKFGCHRHLNQSCVCWRVRVMVKLANHLSFYSKHQQPCVPQHSALAVQAYPSLVPCQKVRNFCQILARSYSKGCTRRKNVCNFDIVVGYGGESISFVAMSATIILFEARTCFK